MGYHSGVDPSSLLQKHYGSRLTERELEVGCLAISGVNTQQIAERMFVSVHTVKSHLRQVFKKTKTANRNDLYRCLVELTESTPALTKESPRPDSIPRDPQTGLLDRRFLAASSESLGDALAVGLILYRHLPTRTDASREEANQDAGIAKVIQRRLRSSDLAFRWSDTAVLILLPNCSAAGAQDIVARLASEVRAWGRITDSTIEVRASVASTDEGIFKLDLLVEMAEARVYGRGETVQ